jgi:hypothetical protein
VSGEIIPHYRVAAIAGTKDFVMIDEPVAFFAAVSGACIKRAVT